MASTILLTGGSGFIGSNLICSLIKRGYRIISILPPNENFNEQLLEYPELAIKVVVVDLQEISSKDWDVMFIKGDIRDRNFIMELFDSCNKEGYKFTYIIHLAACSTIQKAFEDENYAWQVNLEGTRNIVDATTTYCKNSDGSYSIKGFVYSSTDKIYGEGSEEPYQEDHEIAPCFPYEKSKAVADTLVREAYNDFKLPAAVVRFCNVYGPRDTHCSRLVPGTLYNILYAHKPPILKMYKDEGSNLQSFRRDMIYIDDITSAIILLLNKLNQYSENPNMQQNIPVYGEAFNLGTENCYRIKDIIEVIQRLLCDKTESKIETVESGEILDQCMSYQKAKSVLGFEPKIKLEEGLIKTVEWYLKEKIDYGRFEA